MAKSVIFNVAAAAILNCYFVTVDHPRSLLHGPNIVLKFHVNCITTVGDMACLLYTSDAADE